MYREPGVNGQRGVSGDALDLRLVEGVVARLPLFRGIDRAHVAMAASATRIERHRRGALVARRGEPIPGIIAVARGKVKLVLPRRNGDEKVLRFVGAAESFGEAAALLERPCPVDACALSETLVAVIPVRPLRRLQERDPAFANNLVRTLAEGLLGLVADIDASVGRSSTQRLAAYLESLAGPHADTARCAVELPVTKTALAARLGITKETMSRLLRELKDQGLILMDRSTITILDRARLAGIVH